METIVVSSDDDRHFKGQLDYYNKAGYKTIFADIIGNTSRAVVVDNRQEVEYGKYEMNGYTTHKGYFHGWAEETIEGSEASNNLRFTMGIIEEEDGTIITVTPARIKFIRG